MFGGKNNMNKYSTFIYTPLSQIKKEIKERWNNKKLNKEVLKFWGSNPFPLTLKKPTAIFCRDIATPNKELSYFLDIAKTLDLEPLILELHKGKFVSKNKSKYHLGNLHFKQEKSPNIISGKIINFNKWEGKMINEIKTKTGDSLISLHHKMLEEEHPGLTKFTYDFSDWFLLTRNLTDYYYLYFLSLFICHAVLFDNYLIDDKEEAEFYLKKVEPSFKKAKEIFGVRPLIYPLLPMEFEESVDWYSYPGHLQKNNL